MGNNPSANDPNVAAITFLDLSNQALSDLKSKLTAAYVNLTEINLANNKLTTLEGISWAAPQLQTVDLSSNHIQNWAEFYSLNKLKKIQAKMCKMQHIDPKISYLKLLTELDVSFNRIKSLPPQIGSLQHLKVLVLTSNALREIPREIKGCVHLKKLIINENQLSFIPPEIGFLAELTQLTLSDNFLQSIPKEVAKLVALQKLHLDQNELLEICAPIGQLTALKECNLRGNQLQDLPNSFGLLTNLMSLDLEENEFTSQKFRTFSSTNLKEFLESVRNQPIQQGQKSRSLRQPKRRVRLEKDEEGNFLVPKLASWNRVDSIANPYARKSGTISVKQLSQEFKKLEFSKRAFVVKGYDKIWLRAVDFSLQSLHQDSVYLLDVGQKLVVWNGNTSSARCKKKARFIAKLFNEEAGNTMEIVIMEGETESHEFLTLFGTSAPGKIIVAEKSEKSDKEFERYHRDHLGFYKVSEASGRLEVSGYMGLPLKKEMLDSSSCFIIDAECFVFVWSGVYSSNSERNWSILKAEQLVTDIPRPQGAKIFWILDGLEFSIFKDQFENWIDPSHWDIREELNVKSENSKENSNFPAKKVALHPEKAEMKEGFIKCLEPGDQWIVHYMIVQDGKLLLFQDEAHAKKHENPLVEFNLGDCVFDDLTDNVCGFEVRSAATGTVRRSVTCVCDSETDKYVWVNVILRQKVKAETLMEEQRKLEKSLKSPKKSDLSKSTEISPTKIPVTSSTSSASSLANSSSSLSVKDTDPTWEKLSPVQRELMKQKQRDKALQGSLSTPSVNNAAVKDSPKASVPPKATIEQPKIEPVIEKQKQTSSPTFTTTSTLKSSASKPSTSTVTPTIKSLEELEKEREEKAKKFANEKPSLDVTTTQSVTSPPQPTKQSSQLQIPPATTITTPTSQPLDQPKSQVHSTSSKTANARLAAAPTGRKAPTKNPLKNRNEIAANTSQFTEKPNVSQPRNLQLGGFGLLYSLGVNENLFQKKETSAPSSPNLTENSLSTLFTEGVSLKDMRLIQIKGRRNIFVRRVEISGKSLNRGDVFLLDTGKTAGIIFQWNGPESNRIEKGKAMDVAKSIKDKERSGMSRVVVIDESSGEIIGSQHDSEKFWKILSKSDISSAEAGGDDAEAEKSMWSLVKLYQVLWEDEKKNLLPQLELVEISCGKLFKEMLEDSNCYILDALSEVYVWTGKKSPMKVKNDSLKLAKEMTKGREIWFAGVEREFPGAESVLFKEKFVNWGSSIPIQMQQVVVGMNTAKTQKQEKIDVAKMYQPPVVKDDVMIDDGKGQVQIWKIEENTKIPLDKSNYGQFYSGESYIVLYTYIWKNKDCFLIYFWQGRNSSIMEKGTSALLTIDLDDKLKGQAKELRVVQNKEPKHFLRIFKGKFLVFLGKEKEKNEEKVSLFQIFGKSDWDIRAIQVDAKCSSLNSNSSFILASPKSVYTWNGKFSTQEQIAVANQIANLLPKKTALLVNEGSESNDFWNLIGGRSVYYRPTKRFLSRMFAFSVGSGVVQVEEVFQFSQDDLLTEDVFLIDGFDQIYVWIGNLSDEKEKKFAMEASMEFLHQVPDDRTKDPSNVYVIYEGEEPITFTSLFCGWDWSKYRKKDPSFTPPDEPCETVETLLSEYSRTYSYEELVNKEYPRGIDTHRLEDYLDPDQFETVFDVSLEEFRKFPLWKQQKMKREKGLY